MPSRILAVAALVTGAALLFPASGSPAFPGANGPIAFVSDRAGNDEIYAVDPDGGDPQRLTANTQIDVDPAVSADGSKIAFARGVTMAGRDNVPGPAAKARVKPRRRCGRSRRCAGADRASVRGSSVTRVVAACHAIRTSPIPSPS